MDLSKQLDTIVSGIVEEIQSRVSDSVTNAVRQELVKQLDKYDFDGVISKLAAEKVATRVSSLEFDQDALQKRINNATGTIVNNVQEQANKDISLLVNKQISQIDFNKKFTDAMSTVIDNRIQDLRFPENSISAASIKISEIELSGDQINGGIIKNFGSTGIDDKATECVMTILDAAVVVENNLVTLDLTVQGNLDVKGTVPETSPFYIQLTSAVTKSVQEGLDTELFSGFSDTIFNKIATNGLDLNKITVDQKTIIEGNRIGYSITESNLQKLGLLKELQVQGETQLAETLYVGNKRIGINTLEPSAALAIWDEDIEITVSKLKDSTGRIATPRNQALVLGSNKNNNIVLNTDGSANIDDLRIGSMRFSTSDKPPSYASTKGHIVFNSNPTLGGPLGWVCLGAANWANFGIVD